MHPHSFEDSCAFLIHDVARLVRKRFDVAVRDLGITQAKWRILASLRLRPGQTQSELAERLDLEKVPVGLALEWLQNAGWIERACDASDRRAKRVTLTTDAESVLNTIQARFSVLSDSYLPVIGEATVVQFTTSLARIRDSLAERAAEAPRAEIAEYGYLTLLLDCARLLNKRFNTRLAELGFTRNEWLVLNTIFRHEGLRQIQIAELTELRAAPLGRLIDGLENQGWIDRREDPDDRRAKRLYATARTHELISAMRERFEALHEELLKPLATGQREALAAALVRMRSTLLDTTLDEPDGRDTDSDHGE